MDAKQNERILTFDILRVLAAFAVVCLHTPSLIWYDHFPSVGWDFSSVYLSLVRWSVPMFVMISGALFLNPKKQIIISRLYTKNILRLLYAFLFWTFIFVLLHPDIRQTAQDFLISMVKGPQHLWFLKMLFGIYVMIPLLRPISANRQTELYFLILSFTTVFALPMLIDLLAMVNPTFADFINEAFLETDLDKIVAFSAYFVLGHFLFTEPLSHKVNLWIYALGIFCFLFVIAETYLYSHYINQPNSIFFDYINPFTYFETAALFVYFKNHFRHHSSKLTSILLDLSACSFGIYLVHYFVMEFMRPLFVLDPYSTLICIKMPVFSFVVFVISYLITKGVKCIPVLGKYIV